MLKEEAVAWFKILSNDNISENPEVNGKINY